MKRHFFGQALPYVCLLMGILFFIYAIIGMQVGSQRARESVDQKLSPDVWQSGNGPLHCHRETQQLQTHLPEPFSPVQVLLTL